MDAALVVLIKTTLVLGAALLTAALLGRAPAIARHRLWTALFPAVIALPLLSVALPALEIPVPAGWAALAGDRIAAPAEPSASTPEPAGAAADRTRREHDSAPVAGPAVPLGTPFNAVQSGTRAAFRAGAPGGLVALWLAGAILATLALARSLVRVRRLARQADEVRDPAWRDAAESVRARLGLRRPIRLVVAPRLSTPMAGGLWRPTIFLPASSDAWSAEYREVVLAHEMVHLAWRDPLGHVVTRLALALYWFNPLAWVAARQAAAAREQACDEAVLAFGTRPSAYARVLLDLASVPPSTVSLGALPMVQPSRLEKRLMSILNHDHLPSGRRLLLPVVALIVLTVSLAAAQLTPAERGRAVAPGASVSMDAAATSPVDATVAIDAASRTVPAKTVQPAAARDSACDWNAGSGISFDGSISTTTRGGATIREQVGRRGSDRIIQKYFGDLKVCMLAEDGATNARPSQLAGRARRVVLESQRGSRVQRLEVAQDGRSAWQVDGQDRAIDATAQEWREAMLALLDTTWEISTLRGRVSSLRGEISSIHGERSSMRGEISSLRGEVSSMRGEISSIRGHESSLRGEISSIRGHLSSLEGAISSERGAISSLNARRYDASDAELARIRSRIAEHEAAIARLEKEIRAYDAEARVNGVERQLAAYDTRGKVAEMEARITAFDLDGKVAAIERRLQALDVEGKVAAIEREIASLDADRRTGEMSARQETELKRVEAAIKAIR